MTLSRRCASQIDMIEQEADIEVRAIRYAKANRTRIARELTDFSLYPADEDPVSIF